MPATKPQTPGADEFAERLRKAIQRLGRASQNHGPEVRTDAEPQAEKAAPNNVPLGEAPEGESLPAEPVGVGDRVVRSGDCLSSIAKEAGHLWETIWEDAANTTLRETRKDPNVLATGDRVTIPPLREKSEPGQTEMRHRFVRVGQPTVFQLRLSDNDEPLAHRQYVIEYDNGESFSNVTNSQGFLRCPMPSDARTGRLVVSDPRLGQGGDEDGQREYKLQFGQLEPVEFLVGVQQRLRNLGFYDGPDSAELDELTRRALRRFQRHVGLGRTGLPDEATRRRLRDHHGS